MNIRPLVGRVLIKKIKIDKIGNLYMPEPSQDKSSRGEVVSVGSFEKDKSFDIKKGDIVIFPTWSGTIISSGSGSESDYVIIKVEEILGVEEDGIKGGRENG